MGHIPLAPGTAASLLALAVYWVVPERFPLPWWLLVIAALFVVGAHTAAIAEKQWGKDPPKVVIDEIVGCFVAMLLLPRSLFAVTISFAAFRAFDILKPFPIRRSERLPGGWGIMADDVVAGIYANGIARLVLWLR